VRCLPAGSLSRMVGAVAAGARVLRGHGDPAAGARAAGVASEDVADCDPPLPVCRVRVGVASKTPARPPSRAKLSRRGLQWPLEGMVCQHLSIARIAEDLAVSWGTAISAVLDEGRPVLIRKSTHLLPVCPD
jgi:hypothetical protein